MKTTHGLSVRTLWPAQVSAAQQGRAAGPARGTGHDAVPSSAVPQVHGEPLLTHC